ncbi:molybdenum ABC transporter ATP-binding protein [Rhodobacteraceae bacterium NNCM2]|nr:molybdenum ABC transporter ATP-binding protein [Coraliihabitans acroporae]
MELDLDLSARYGEFGLDARGVFDIRGITALFGPSGAGKSSILSAIAGFRPGLGRIAVNGEVWQDRQRMIPPHRRPVGMVFQSGRLFTHLTVAGNLRYAERRAPSNDKRITREMVVEALGIGRLLDQQAGTLSGGQVQRVAIARALMTKPRLLLMDEPLGAIDRRAKADLLSLISTLPEAFELPVIFVSHQLEEIAQIATKMIAVHEGQIIGDGPLASMMETLDPQTTGRFEAGALIVGRAAGHDSEYAMQAVDLGPARIWLPTRSPLDEGREVRIRLRARDVSIALGPVAGLSIRNQIPARVQSIEPETGSFAEVVLDCGGQTFRARSTRMSVAELGITPGMEVVALIKSVAFDRRLG